MKTTNCEISHALQSLREQRIALSPKPLLALVKVALLAHLDVHLVVHLDAHQVVHLDVHLLVRLDVHLVAHLDVPKPASNGLRGPSRRKGLPARGEGSFSAGITAW